MLLNMIVHGCLVVVGAWLLGYGHVLLVLDVTLTCVHFLYRNGKAMCCAHAVQELRGACLVACCAALPAALPHSWVDRVVHVLIVQLV